MLLKSNKILSVPFYFILVSSNRSFLLERLARFNAEVSVMTDSIAFVHK
jgi:hypothetical protein